LYDEFRVIPVSEKSDMVRPNLLQQVSAKQPDAAKARTRPAR